jgi:putative hemolysin
MRRPAIVRRTVIKPSSLCKRAVTYNRLVIDEDRRGDAGEFGRVVGTYRLLRESVAHGAGGFYSASEFDLSSLTAHQALAGTDSPRELLELGRSCVLPAYRTSATIQLL